MSRVDSDGRLCVPLLFTWAFLLGWRPMQNTDIWWHLRTGQLIWERGQVPFSDWFLFTDMGQPWIDLHWGFQLLAAGIYALGERLSPGWGVNLLVLAKAFCLLATVAVGWSASRRHLSPWGTALGWILPIICLSGRAVVRPEMLSLLFLATWLWILSRGEHTPRLMWWLPPLQVVWTNCQGLFVLGLLLGAAYGVDRLVRCLAGGRWGVEPAPEAPSGITVACVGVLVGVACLINPYLNDGALFPLELYKKFSVDQVLYMNIGEFQRPLDTIHHHGWSLYFASAAVLWVGRASQRNADAPFHRFFGACVASLPQPYGLCSCGRMHPVPELGRRFPRQVHAEKPNFTGCNRSGRGSCIGVGGRDLTMAPMAHCIDSPGSRRVDLHQFQRSLATFEWWNPIRVGRNARLVRSCCRPVRRTGGLSQARIRSASGSGCSLHFSQFSRAQGIHGRPAGGRHY